MKKAGKWRISLALVLLLLTLMPTTALAARPSTSYTLNGSEADNIVAVAVAQSKVTPKLSGSDFGFGSSSWCGYFISWCAKKAGVSCIPSNITGGRSSIAEIVENNLGEFYCYADALTHCNDSYNNYSIYKYLSSHPKHKLNNSGRSHMHEVSRGDFKPLKGDIVIFLKRTDYIHPQFSHVGLVREDYSGKGPLLTVEGNTTEKYTVACQERSIAKSAFMQIVGYVRPNYSDSPSSSNQKPEPAPSSSVSVKTDTYYTIKNLGSGKMLNVYGSGKADGTNVTVYSADGTSGQDFKFISNSSGTYVLQPVL